MMKTLLLGTVVLVMSACSTSMDGEDRVLEKKLENSIGLKFTSTDWSRPTGARQRQLPSDGGKKYYEYAWKNSCIFVISVDASTDVILSWRYTSESETCRDIRSYTFGT